MVVSTLRAIDAQCDISIWPKKGLAKVDPADPPPRNRELSIPTEPLQEIAINDERFSIIELFWMRQQTNLTQLLPLVYKPRGPVNLLRLIKK